MTNMATTSNQTRPDSLPRYGLNFDKSRPKTASLGKDANIVAKPPKQDRWHSFKLLSHAQSLMIDQNIKSERSGNIHRTRLCHAVRSGHVDKITLRVSQNPESKHASLAGVQTCGSIWSCPVCAKRIAVQRGNEISQTIDYMVNTGHVPVMLTFTASHKVDTILSVFLDKLKKAYRKFIQDGSLRRLKKRLGVSHAIKAFEVTRTHKNGWHPHQHVILFAHSNIFSELSPDELESIISDMKKIWLRCLDTYGLHGTDRRALDFKVSKNIKKDYLSKLGLEQTTETNLKFELSGSGGKYKGRNIWSILQSSLDGNEDDSQHYIDYVTAMAGTNWITFSRGLKDMVGLNDVEDIEASEDESNDTMIFEDFMSLSDDEYAPVRHFKAYAELLKIAGETRDKKAVIEFLIHLETMFEKTEKHRIRARMLEQYNALDAWLVRYRQMFNRRAGSENPSEEFTRKAEQWKQLKKALHIK